MSEIIENRERERQEAQAVIVKKLLEKYPGTEKDIIALVAATRPRDFLIASLRREKLHLVSNESDAILTEMGVAAPQAPTLIVPESRELLSQRAASLEPTDFSRNELRLYAKQYFADDATCNHIIDIFWGETSLTDNQIDLRDALARIHGAGVKGHVVTFPANGARDVRESQTGAEHHASGEIVAFPRAILPRDEEDVAVALASYRERSKNEMHHFVIDSFRFCVIQLAQIHENHVWFSGAQPISNHEHTLVIPDGIRHKLELLASIEQHFALPAYTEQLENSIAAVISYYYPQWVSNDSVKKARRLKKKHLIIPAEEGEDKISPELVLGVHDIDESDTAKQELFTMRPEDAALLGFKDVVVRCSIHECEEMLKEESQNREVAFEIEGRLVTMSVKSFLHMFHKQTVTSTELIGQGGVVDFPGREDREPRDMQD